MTNPQQPEPMTNNKTPDVVSAETLTVKMLECRYLDGFDGIQEDKIEAFALVNKYTTALLAPHLAKIKELEEQLAKAEHALSEARPYINCCDCFIPERVIEAVSEALSNTAGTEALHTSGQGEP